MKIEFDINEKYQENKIIICTNKITEDVKKLIEKIRDEENIKLYGYKDEKIFILEENKIESIYSEDKKVFARTESNEIFEIKKRIYELENVLSEKFVRISNSEIVNFSKVQSLDFKIIGTIVLKFYTDRYTYVSRRYVKKIKEYLRRYLYEKKYINILKRFFWSVVIGVASITINLISCYFLFGNDGYKYEVIQYSNISNLILRIIYSSIFYFIILIAVKMDKSSDDMIKKLSFKKYLFFKMIIIGIVIINSILSIFILDRFIKDEIFAISFCMDLFIISLLFTISTIIYKKSLEKKINDKLKRI